MKSGVLGRRHGLIFRSYRSYTAHLLDNGLMLFYQDEKEDKAMRLELDSSLRLTDQVRGKTERFTLRIGKTAVHLEGALEEQWVEAIVNLRIKK